MKSKYQTLSILQMWKCGLQMVSKGIPRLMRKSNRFLGFHFLPFSEETNKYISNHFMNFNFTFKYKGRLFNIYVEKHELVN